MKDLLLFIQRGCPYCKRALAYQKQLIEQEPAYAQIPIEIVDEFEQRERANSFDYYYVPTYYCGGQKIHEGAASLDDIKAVLNRALER